MLADTSAVPQAFSPYLLAAFCMQRITRLPLYPFRGHVQINVLKGHFEGKLDREQARDTTAGEVLSRANAEVRKSSEGAMTEGEITRGFHRTFDFQPMC